jgi:hypothetical protein
VDQGAHALRSSRRPSVCRLAATPEPLAYRCGLPGWAADCERERERASLALDRKVSPPPPCDVRWSHDGDGDS